jgi:hypothetical protein
MKTKDILLFVGGIALGYYASKMNWGKNTTSGVTNNSNPNLKPTGGTPYFTPTEGRPFIQQSTKATYSESECASKWKNEIGKRTEFATNEAMNTSKSNYITKCMFPNGF